MGTTNRRQPMFRSPSSSRSTRYVRAVSDLEKGLPWTSRSCNGGRVRMGRSTKVRLRLSTRTLHDSPARSLIGQCGSGATSNLPSTSSLRRDYSTRRRDALFVVCPLLLLLTTQADRRPRSPWDASSSSQPGLMPALPWPPSTLPLRPLCAVHSLLGRRHGQRPRTRLH